MTTAPIVDLRSNAPPSTWGVTVDYAAISDLAERWRDTEMPPSEWDYPGLPAWDGTAWLDFCVAGVAVVVCLWPPTGAQMWQVEFDDMVLEDAPALFSRFAQKLEPRAGHLPWSNIADWSLEDGQEFFHGRGHLQLMNERTERLRDVATSMLRRWDGKAINLVRAAGGSAPRIAELLIDTVPGYRDEAVTATGILRFNKLAHLSVAMMSARSPIPISAVDTFPVYPDYILPMVLRHFGVLRYAPDLADTVDSRRLVTAGSEGELGIRWATIHAADELRAALNYGGNPASTPDLDYFLWHSGVLGPEAATMGHHHRTVTMAY